MMLSIAQKKVTNDTVINNEMESGHVLIFGYITAFAWSD
jgi:hypothetical protein